MQSERGESNSYNINEESIELSDYGRPGNFTYLEVNVKVTSFKYHLYPDFTFSGNLDFIEKKKEYSLIIFLSIEDDTELSSEKLQKTLNAIFSSFPELEKININNSNILICLFFLQFTSEQTFKQIYPFLNYLSSCCAGDPDYNCASLYYLSTKGMPISIISFNKNFSTKVECLRMFYIYVLNEIYFSRDKKDNLHLFIIENGMIPSATAMKESIRCANNCPLSIVPSIDLIPNNIYGEILQFDVFLEQIFSLNFYDMTSAPPLDHRFYYMQLNRELYTHCSDYFKTEIYSDAGIGYHDYRFGLFLSDKGSETFYIKEIKVKYKENKMTFNDIMNKFSNKRGANLLLFFPLIYSLFVNCIKLNVFTFIKKVFLFFQTLEILFEFIKPAITILAFFSILSEALCKEDERIVIFFIIIYSLIIICTCCFSLISPKPSGGDNTFIVLDVLFYVYFVFILICLIIAIYFIKINDTNDKYNFSYIALTCLFILNAFFITIPVFFRFGQLFENFRTSYKYFFIAYPCYISVFSYHAMMNFTDLYGQMQEDDKTTKLVKLHERKKIFVLLFFLTNSFFCFTCFFLNSRTQRVKLLFSMGIMLTILLASRMIGITVSVCRLRVRMKKMKVKEIAEEAKKEEKENKSKLEERKRRRRNSFCEEKSVITSGNGDKDKAKENDLISNISNKVKKEEDKKANFFENEMMDIENGIVNIKEEFVNTIGEERGKVDNVENKEVMMDNIESKESEVDDLK